MYLISMKPYQDYYDLKNVFPFFKFKPVKILDKYERWRKLAKDHFKVSKEAKLRLEWIIYRYQGHSLDQVCKHFGISKKTFCKWYKIFDPENIHTIKLLEDRSKAPKNKRQKTITTIQEQRIIALRKQYIRYGKMKLAKKYEDEFKEKISSHQIQQTIKKFKLYYKPKKTARTQAKRLKANKKKRITELNLDKLKWYQKKAGYIICLDTVVIHWGGVKRYFFTAIDKYGKVAYARVYKTKSTINSRDFLTRLYFLFNGKITRVGHDNGSEFEKYFKALCIQLGITQYYSRVRTPKDNPNNERFNQTLKHEFLDLGNFTPDVDEMNRRLTEWLIEYNFKRPHETLNYETPLQFVKELPMYSSWTNA